MRRVAPQGPVAFLLNFLRICGSGATRRTSGQRRSERRRSEAAGLESAWTLRTILDEIVKDNQKLEPLLAQMNPQEWVSKKGASDVYVQQWQVARTQLNEAMAATKLLAQKTESLPLALDAYFRLEALEVTSRSLEEAVTKYGDRFTADQLDGLIARNFSRRQRFRDYIRDLAASSETNFKLADEEAQRCRGIISREPVKRAKKQ